MHNVQKNLGGNDWAHLNAGGIDGAVLNLGAIDAGAIKGAQMKGRK